MAKNRKFLKRQAQNMVPRSYTVFKEKLNKVWSNLQSSFVK